MKYNNKRHACFVTIAFLLCGAANATNITFSDTERTDTFARVLFQLGDESGNVAAKLDQNTLAQLQKAISVYEFKGEHNTHVKIVAPTSQNTMQLVVVGLGAPDELDRAAAVSVGGAIAQLFTHKDVQKIDIVLSGITGKLTNDVLAANIAHGISLGAYRFNNYLQDATEPNNSYHIVVESEKQANNAYQSMRAIERGVFLARDMVNTNGAELDPETFAEQATLALKGLDVSVEILDDKQIKQLNMGLLYAVGQGSVSGSRMVIARYNGKGNDDQPIALVGKGITFDTGGYNIKTHESIARMKGDMAGAAAVLGTIKALAEQKARVNVVAVMPLAKNLVSETALLPGDIITSMSGKSVEIINTDAEGRLIMADANTYVQTNYQPKILVNMATLTGSKIRAVGNKYSAVFSDDDELLEQLTTAGENVNELLWRLPLDYGDKLKSTLADTRNTGTEGPGATTAAMFLKQFVDDETRWAHIDIAGSEMSKTTQNEVPAGGVGYGVRLLVEWLSTVE